MSMSSSNTTPTHIRRIGLRMVGAVIAFTFCVAVLVSSIQIYSAYRTELVDAQKHFVDIEKSYLPSLAAGMWSVDQERVDALLDGMAQLPDVGFIELRDELQQRWTRRHDKYESDLLSRSFSIVHREGDEEFHLGELTVSLMSADIDARTLHTAKSVAITTCITLFSTVFFVLFIVRRWITRHLETMADYAQTLDLNNLDKPLELTRAHSEHPDELGLVVNAINKMRLSIKNDLNKRNHLYQELSVYRNQLERLVTERTIDLEYKSQQLELKSLELIEQNNELDAYAHTVAHDLKQPISTLLGASSLLSNEELHLSAEKNRALVDSIQRSAHKMRSIIDSLLLLSSIRKCEHIALVDVDTQQTANESCNRLQQLIDQQHAKIVMGESWPKVQGHEQWIEEIWVNYLSNALKYGGANPTIELGTETLASGLVKCWVKDSGPGLNEKQQHEIFDKFVRFDPTAADGHGLGLSIVKRITLRLGGEVGYEPAPGGGSIFWFSLKVTDKKISP
ncbi:MAG: ATP-binding protein [Cellvibrio sp.]|uniref:sensor histidine kinase n=1 Tax=Cellvibrio sp. TaxID=1965322 RepID=UPI0031B4D172